MAGDWIKMRGNLWDDPRVARLCDLSESSEAAIVGGLYWLWAAADQHSQDGVMPGLTVRAIDRKTGIPGFAEALVSVGWLADHPEGVRLIRFEEHNGESAKRRSVDAQRKANVRKVSEPTRTNLGQSADGLRTDCGQNAPNLGAREREEKRREEKEKKEPKSKAETATPAALPAWLPADCWTAFVEMRKAIKKPLTPGGIPLAVQKLDTLRAAGHDPRAVLEQSTLNSWQGLFEIKPQYAKQGAQSQKFNFANADRSGDQLAQAESMARHGITSIPDGDIEI